MKTILGQLGNPGGNQDFPAKFKLKLDAELCAVVSRGWRSERSLHTCTQRLKWVALAHKSRKDAPWVAAAGEIDASFFCGALSLTSAAGVGCCHKQVGPGIFGHETCN
jgi:hypothetical protein